MRISVTDSLPLSAPPGGHIELRHAPATGVIPIAAAAVAHTPFEDASIEKSPAGGHGPGFALAKTRNVLPHRFGTGHRRGVTGIEGDRARPELNIQAGVVTQPFDRLRNEGLESVRHDIAPVDI